MTKERIILAFVAILAGLIFASSGFYFFQNKKLPSSETTNQEVSPAPSKNDSLAIESPEDESVTNNKTIEIKGKYLPNSTIIFMTDDTDLTASASADGTFSQKINLLENDNMITIIGVSEKETQMRDLLITYTQEEL